MALALRHATDAVSETRDAPALSAHGPHGHDWVSFWPLPPARSALRDVIGCACDLMFSSDGRARTAADEALNGAGGGGSDAMLSGDGLGHACVSLCSAWPLSWLVGRHHGCATSGFEKAEVGEVQRSKGPWSPEHAGCGVRSWSCRRLDAFRASWRPRGAGLSVLA
jgi:hypothetical protein